MPPHGRAEYTEILPEGGLCVGSSGAAGGAGFSGSSGVPGFSGFSGFSESPEDRSPVVFAKRPAIYRNKLKFKEVDDVEREESPLREAWGKSRPGNFGHVAKKAVEKAEQQFQTSQKDVTQALNKFLANQDNTPIKKLNVPL